MRAIAKGIDLSFFFWRVLPRARRTLTWPNTVDRGRTLQIMKVCESLEKS